jgi:hypothetical protein
MGFEKYPDPVDVKEKELLRMCNTIMFPPAGTASFGRP